MSNVSNAGPGSIGEAVALAAPRPISKESMIAFHRGGILTKPRQQEGSTPVRDGEERQTSTPDVMEVTLMRRGYLQRMGGVGSNRKPYFWERSSLYHHRGGFYSDAGRTKKLSIVHSDQAYRTARPQEFAAVEK
jgi:hypothetical protein